jgi:hypothetical protein
MRSMREGSEPQRRREVFRLVLDLDLDHDLPT